CGSNNIYKDGSPTFSDNCVPGWMPSHGTPQLTWINFNKFQFPNATPSSHPEWYVIYMWANDDDNKTRGEGILAPFTFKQGNTYKIAIRYHAVLNNPSGQSNGELIINA